MPSKKLPVKSTQAGLPQADLADLNAAIVAFRCIFFGLFYF